MTEQEKRAKVIAEIERIADEANPWKESPPLRCDISYPLLIDTLALLKAQEAPTDVSISSAIECLLHPQDADDSDMAKAIDTAVRAMRLLKAQEPRVMTLEELEDWDGAVFFEAFETDMYYALIETVEPTAGMNGAYVFVNVVPGDHHRRVWGGEHYGSIWRCWTSRPTDEQREATPWQTR